MPLYIYLCHSAYWKLYRQRVFNKTIVKVVIYDEQEIVYDKGRALKEWLPPPGTTYFLTKKGEEFHMFFFLALSTRYNF